MCFFFQCVLFFTNAGLKKHRQFFAKRKSNTCFFICFLNVGNMYKANLVVKYGSERFGSYWDDVPTPHMQLFGGWVDESCQ